MGKICFCGKPAYAKGRCKKHYQQRQRRKQSIRVPRVIRRQKRKKK